MAWHERNGAVTIQQGVLPDEYTIYYDGILSGADQVYLHYGYGAPDWTHIRTEEMAWTGTRWRKTVTSSGHWTLCFKDSADHWDNNGGLNWTVR